MNTNSFPTKGNLILAKNSLTLSKQGYSLMDKKRNILMRELMNLIDKAKEIQDKIDISYSKAYKALQRANIEMGLDYVTEIAGSVPIDNRLNIKTRSVMGTEIPLVEYEHDNILYLTYAYYSTRESIDIARELFEEVKKLTIQLSSVEISAYRLAENIAKTQKRANALKNITIPRYNNLTKTITNALEEKEREEFTRLKVIKRKNF